MRHAPSSNWIPPRPAPRSAALAPAIKSLREAGLTATLAVALSWGVAEFTLLLVG